MNTLRIEILNPKAGKLLKNLADLNLITIQKPKGNELMALVKKIRAKAIDSPPTLKEITKEVELVRAQRYAQSKK